MSITKLLPIARSVGAENWVKLKPFIRDVGNKTIGQQAVRLKINQLQVNGLEKFLSALPQSARDQFKFLFADALKPGNKTGIDILVKRFTPKSGVVGLKATMKDAAGKTVAGYNAKVAVNSAGVNGRGSMTYNPGRVRESINISYLENANGPKAQIRDFIGRINYRLKNGLFKVQLPQTKVGGLTAKVNFSADEKYLSKATEIASNGVYKSAEKGFASYLDQIRLLGVS